MKNENRMKLTKKSEKALFDWHAGAGRAFISSGTGKETKNFDFYFRKNKNGTFLGMGDSKMIKLTTEQEAIIGEYAAEEIIEE